MIYGFLRETQEKAISENNKNTKFYKTGLDVYLNTIFPDVIDWVHDKVLYTTRKRPDYRSDSLKLIVEFDGLPHYQKPDIILNDYKSIELYNNFGYKVVRIPYFIQLTNDAVKTLFSVDVKTKLFDENISSLSSKYYNTPAYLCTAGIKRMANEFLKFEQQYKVNLESMKKEDLFLTRYDLLEQEYNNLKRDIL